MKFTATQTTVKERELTLKDMLSPQFDWKEYAKIGGFTVTSKIGKSYSMKVTVRDNEKIVEIKTANGSGPVCFRITITPELSFAFVETTVNNVIEQLEKTHTTTKKKTV